MTTQEIVQKIELNDKEVMDVNRRALHFLQQHMKDSCINILDVGCARGSLSDYVRNRGGFSFSNSYIVGIDPLNHNVNDMYDVYLQVAVDDVGDSPVISKFYINSDDQASSLLLMDFENITSDINDKEKYYLEWIDNLKIVDVTDVSTISLRTVINELFSKEGRKIHFLKIDAEGKDLNIVKSMHLEKHHDAPLFVSLECSSHRKNTNTRIFKGGCHKEEVIPYMESLGYEILDCFDYEFIKNNNTNVSDIVFVHTPTLRSFS